MNGDGVRPRASAHAAAVNGATLRVPSVRSRQSRSAKLPKICRKRQADVQPDVQGVRVVAAEVAVRQAVRRAGHGVEEGLEPCVESNFGRLTSVAASVRWRGDSTQAKTVGCRKKVPGT